MSKLIPQNELNEILNCLKNFSEGISSKELHKRLEITLPAYTLQRRLNFLINNGLVEVKGKARARRYFLLKIEEDDDDSEKLDTDLLPLSEEAKSLQRAIKQPEYLRVPVNYNRKFLDQYRPNVSYYLSKETRQKLHKLGKTNGERPAGTYAREIYNRLLVELSWNSSRLEGNTYSLLETERLLNFSEIAEGKSLVDTQMILNHKEAIEFVVDCAEEIDVNRHTVLNIHALLSNNLLADPSACGRVRSNPVGIKKSVYNPLVIPNLINECFEQILDTARAIQDPFEQAFFLMLQLPYLQPFEDVNKRVSRLVANIPLIRLNLAPLSFMDVPRKAYINGLLAVYELNNVALLRDVFVWAYERSCALYSLTVQNIGEPDPFRMRYKIAIFDTVSYIVKDCMNKKEAIASIKQKASQIIPTEDQLRFIETVEIELRGLHEGNIARYKLRPSEYMAWNAIWK